jgi:hypothetical protein
MANVSLHSLSRESSSSSPGDVCRSTSLLGSDFDPQLVKEKILPSSSGLQGLVQRLFLSLSGFFEYFSGPAPQSVEPAGLQAPQQDKLRARIATALRAGCASDDHTAAAAARQLNDQHIAAIRSMEDAIAEKVQLWSSDHSVAARKTGKVTSTETVTSQGSSSTVDRIESRNLCSSFQAAIRKGDLKLAGEIFASGRVPDGDLIYLLQSALHCGEFECAKHIFDSAGSRIPSKDLVYLFQTALQVGACGLVREIWASEGRRLPSKDRDAVIRSAKQVGEGVFAADVEKSTSRRGGHR